MIRFRIGQSWKRERAAPVDGFGLELDGVNVLSGAGEEPLTKVVPDLVDAVYRLHTEAQPVAQASLPEAHVELVFLRDRDDVELSIVSLSRPARRVRPALTLDLEDLSAATARCARTLLTDLDAAAPGTLKGPRRKQLVGRIEKLESGEPEELERTSAGGWSYEQFARAPGDFGFRILDPRDRLMTFDRRGEAPLSSLLVDGTLSLRLSAQEVWSSEAPIFLAALELSRQSGELVHALEVGDPQFRFRPGGLGPELTVDLRAETISGHAGTHPVKATALARGMVDLSVGLAAAAASRNKTQSKNPYLQELTARARDVLSHLQPPRASTRGKASRPRTRRGAEARPLEGPGRVRRLRFEQRWEKGSLGGEGDVRLQLTARGVVVAGPELAMGFSPTGEVRFRRLSARGVAIAPDEGVLVSEPQRLLFFEGSAPQAHWLRSHDGLPLGPDLLRKDGLLLTTSEGRAAVAISEVTGREVWRAVPPRTQRSFLVVQAHRVLLATDAGYLYGLELADGQIRYRIRAPLPFQQAPVSWGRRLLAVLGRGSQHALFAADAHSGEIAWEQELALTRPSAPLIQGSRAFVAGERDGDGVLLCYGGAGRPVWERALHLGQGRFALKAVGRSVLVVSQSGAATLLSPEGAVEWHLGAAGEPIAAPIPAVVSRGVLVIPGEKVRAVDPQGGQVLAEVSAGSGLCDLRTDARLNLYLLDEAGTLRAFRLATQLSVVDGA